MQCSRLSGQRTAFAAATRPPVLRRQITVTVTAAKGFGAKAPPAVTCPCGSKVVYKDCCEPVIVGKAAAPSAEAVLRARFTACVKDKQDFMLVSDQRAGVDRDQLKRDVDYACSNFSYSNLKIGSAKEEGDEASLEFTYSRKYATGASSPPPRSRLMDKTSESRAGNRNTREKAREPARNVDGSIKVTKVNSQNKMRKVNGAWVVVEETITEQE